MRTTSASVIEGAKLQVSALGMAACSDVLCAAPAWQPITTLLRKKPMHVASWLLTSAVCVATLAASSAWGQQTQTVGCAAPSGSAIQSNTRRPWQLRNPLHTKNALMGFSRTSSTWSTLPIFPPQPERAQRRRGG